MKNIKKYKNKATLLLCMNLILFLTGFSRPISPKIGNATLSGKVFDSENKTSLVGASVYIHDLKLGAVSDSVGNYQITGLPSGTFLVEVSYVGYKTITKDVVINGDTKIDFDLTETPIEQSAVVVTGLSKATQVRRSPIPITTIKKEYIDSHVGTNAIDAISAIPGVSAVTTGPNVSKPFIRGLGYNRILTLYDGVRQEGQQWGDEHGVEVDQYSVDHYEVVKGPASLSYGSDALAGVVNLIPTQPPTDGKILGNVLAEYQSNNGAFGGSAMLSGNNKGIEWSGRLSHKAATNYENKYDGRVFGTAFNETDANASVGIHRKWGYSHLNFVLYDNLQLIPDGSRDSVSRKFTKQTTEADIFRPIVSDQELTSYTIADKTHQHIQHYRAFWNNNFVIGDGLLTANIGFQRSMRQEFSHPERLDIPGLFLELNTYNYDFKYALPEINGWNVLLGVNGMYQNNTVTHGTEFVIPSYNQFDFGPFVLLKRSFDKLDISGGIRYDTRAFSNDALYTTTDKQTGFDTYVNNNLGDFHFASTKHNYSGASGSIGLAYNFSNTFSLKANIARGYRAPNISEISSNGVHPGTNVYQLSNPNFLPEFSTQEDIGVVYATKYVSASLSVFNNAIDNYIYNQKLINKDGSDSVIVAGNQTFQFQQGQARLYGGELSLDIHPVASIHFENSISVVMGDNKKPIGGISLDSSKYLPFIPPLHGTSELRYSTDFKSAHINNFYVYGQISYYAAQNRAYLAYGTETPTPGYVLTNIGVGANFMNKKGKSILNASVLGNNIFDVAYQSNMSRLKYFEPYPNNFTGRNGIYNLGRNISFKVSVPIGK